MTTTRRGRRPLITRAVQAMALAALVACGAGETTTGTSAPSSPHSTLSPFLVSNPRLAAPIAGAVAGARNVAAAGSEVVYIALPPGSIPNADIVTIRVRPGGTTVTAKAADGGFDPVAVPANPGDTLEIEVRVLGNDVPTRYVAPVPKSARPIVIRTSPPPKKRDVPINTNILVVFSEPIAFASLNSSTVQVGTGATRVPGQLVFADSAGVSVTFTPGTALAAATDYTLIVTQGILDLDGQALDSAVTVPFTTEAVATTLPLSSAQAIATGAHVSCAITAAGKAYCWGINARAQLGTGPATPNNSLTPVAVAAPGPFVAIDASENSVCALDANGTPWCWGQIPGATPSSAGSPRPIAQPSAPRPLVSITVGAGYLCGLDAAGTAYCWGRNGNGQLGVGDTLARNTPSAVDGGRRFASISAGYLHTCALTDDGVAYCWGHGAFGEIGTGVPLPDPVTTPTAVQATTPFRSVSAGSLNSCAIARTGPSYCWGSNLVGALGIGSVNPGPYGSSDFFSSIPVRVGGAVNMATIAPGKGNYIFEHMCAIATTGTPYCWGPNEHGQVGAPVADVCAGVNLLGRLNPPCALFPAPVSGIGTVVALRAGLSHTCALTSSHAVMCWGSNTNGELGDGSTTDRAAPVIVLGGLSFP